MTATLITPPLIEPVSLADMKSYLRLEHTLEDSLIRAFITAARVHLEQLTRRAFIAQTWRIEISGPRENDLRLPLQPASDILSAAVMNRDGDLLALNTSDFRILQHSDPAILRWANDRYLQHDDGLQVDIRFGYGEAEEDVPEPIRQAIRVVAAHWFEKRLVTDPDSFPDLSRALEPLIASYRSPRL